MRRITTASEKCFILRRNQERLLYNKNQAEDIEDKMEKKNRVIDQELEKEMRLKEENEETRKQLHDQVRKAMDESR